MSTSASADPRRIASLDGLRAVSIGLVLLEHLAGTPGFPFGLRSLRRFGELGNFGVRVFFVISGFLITTLLLGELRASGRISLGGFYVRRFFRIFPAAYTFIAVVFLLDSLNWLQVLPGDFGAALTYTMNFHQPKSTWMVHLWSLSIEEQFYIFWPALLMVAGARRAVWVAIAQVVLAPILRVIVWFRFPDHRNFQQFELVMDSIASGCLLALLRGPLAELPLYARLLRSPWFYVIPIGVMGASMASEYSFAAYMARDTIMNIGIALCVDRFVSHPGDRVGRFLNLPALCYVGTLSYSLYLWQELYVERGSSALVQRFPLNLLLIVATGMASYYLVERPMLRLRSRLARRWLAGRQGTAEIAAVSRK